MHSSLPHALPIPPPCLHWPHEAANQAYAACSAKHSSTKHLPPTLLCTCAGMSCPQAHMPQHGGCLWPYADRRDKRVPCPRQQRWMPSMQPKHAALLLLCKGWPCGAEPAGKALRNMPAPQLPACATASSHTLTSSLASARQDSCGPARAAVAAALEAHPVAPRTPCTQQAQLC